MHREIHQTVVARAALAAALALIGACAPRVVPASPSPAPEPVAVGLPPVPRVEGPLNIRVAYPVQGAAKPRVDSTFIFGSVGSGAASLTINGAPVPVAPNGAFLAYLPIPENGAWELAAQAGNQLARDTVAYRPPPPPDTTARQPTPRPTPTVFPQPRAAVVVGVRDTLATGSDAARVYPVANTDVNLRWLLPNGTRVVAVEQRGNLIGARLDERTMAWFPAAQLRLGEPVTAASTQLRGAVEVRPSAGWVDVRIPISGNAFLVGGDGRSLSITLHGVALPAGAPNLSGDSMLAGGSWDADSLGATRLNLQLSRGVWGYKAFYEPDGTLVFRLRRPPRIDPQNPLRGVRIVVDPGHPPGGAVGPTGLTEPVATLPVALRLADQLRRAGAEVLMTRTGPGTLTGTSVQGTELSARVDFAVQNNADLLVSVHYNAFGEGTNPFRNHGTSVLYFQPHARELAALLDREIVGVTRVPDLGAKWQNIALGRPTWMPAVLTESLFMMFPEQENAMRDAGFQERLAAAHVRGIEAFLRTWVTEP